MFFRYSKRRIRGKCGFIINAKINFKPWISRQLNREPIKFCIFTRSTCFFAIVKHFMYDDWSDSSALYKTTADWFSQSNFAAGAGFPEIKRQASSPNQNKHLPLSPEQLNDRDDMHARTLYAPPRHSLFLRSIFSLTLQELIIYYISMPLYTCGDPKLLCYVCIPPIQSYKLPMDYFHAAREFYIERIAPSLSHFAILNLKYVSVGVAKVGRKGEITRDVGRALESSICI